MVCITLYITMVLMLELIFRFSAIMIFVRVI